MGSDDGSALCDYCGTPLPPRDSGRPGRTRRYCGAPCRNAARQDRDADRRVPRLPPDAVHALQHVRRVLTDAVAAYVRVTQRPGGPGLSSDGLRKAASDLCRAEMAAVDTVDSVLQSWSGSGESPTDRERAGQERLL
jgi:hypothetical protein